MEECIQLVQANCDWANIANVDATVLTGESGACWCQEGNDLTPDDSSEFLNCWFGQSNDTDFSTTGSDGVFLCAVYF